MTEDEKSHGTATDAHPGGDERFQKLDATMKRHRHQPDALIEVLHAAQEIFGHLDHDLLLYVARGLKLPPSRAYGVATFYHLFTFAPKGEHTCLVCLGTACYVRGAYALLATVEQVIGVQPGQTTPDGRISVDTARCIGTCGLAPLLAFDGEVCGDQTPESVRRHLGGWDKHESHE
jgi:bidirectional [NiFe] hydrogenase diaphorase subunit